MPAFHYKFSILNKRIFSYVASKSASEEITQIKAMMSEIMTQVAEIKDPSSNCKLRIPKYQVVYKMLWKFKIFSEYFSGNKRVDVIISVLANAPGKNGRKLLSRFAEEG